MSERRPYIVEGEIQPGTGVVQGSSEIHIKAPESDGSGDYIGVYPYESNEKKEDGEHAGIVLLGSTKALAGGTVTAGKLAILKDDASGSFVNFSYTEGQNTICGIFLQSGEAGEYVDMLVGHSSVTILPAE